MVRENEVALRTRRIHHNPSFKEFAIGLLQFGLISLFVLPANSVELILVSLGSVSVRSSNFLKLYQNYLPDILFEIQHQPLDLELLIELFFVSLGRSSKVVLLKTETKICLSEDS